MNRKVPKDEKLKELYLNQEKTMAEIAKIVGVSAKTIFKHLTRLGITRSRSAPRKAYGKKLEKRLENDIKDISKERHIEYTRRKREKTYYFCQKCGKETKKYYWVTVVLAIAPEKLKYCKDCYLTSTVK